MTVDFLTDWGWVPENIKSQDDSKTSLLSTCKDGNGDDCVELRFGCVGFEGVLVIQVEKLKALRLYQARIQEKCLG